jgi:phytanoyl-CoA hydroxylase
MKKFECPDFVLGEKITEEQYSFFDKYGVIIFKNFLNSESVKLYISELNRIEKQWLDEGRDKINGIPLKFGKDEHGNKMIQRMCFLSLYSNPLHELLQDSRVQATTGLLSPMRGVSGKMKRMD